MHSFPGHIACDSASNSEIVVPLVTNDKVVGVFDLDNVEVNGWEEEDRVGLESICRMLEKVLHWKLEIK